MNQKHLEAIQSTLEIELWRIQKELELSRGKISTKRSNYWIQEQVISGKLELLERILNE
jgi:hypothetical protein